MAAPKSIERARLLHVALNDTLLTQLDLHLYSELESRIPKGAYKAFLEDRLREFFSWRRVPIAHLGFPEGFFVAGPPEMLSALENHIKTLQKGAPT